MKKLLIFITLLGVFSLSYSQKNEPFSSLFNGKDLNHWTMPGEVPGFKVVDGIIIAEPQNASNLYTKEQFGNFILKFEFLLSKVGNSGVLIRCDPQHPWETGVEIQLLAPWTPYRDDLHCTGSIYGHVAVTNRPDETTGKWHQMEIKCDRKNITISVNGEVTTLADIDTVESMNDKHLFGAIGFQSNHGEEGEYVHLRNISIRNFDTEPEYVMEGFYADDARLIKQAYEAAVLIGAPMIKPLSRMMAEVHPKSQAGAKQVLFDIVAQSTAPGASDSEKMAVKKALQSSLKESEIVSEYLDKLLKMVKSK